MAIHVANKDELHVQSEYLLTVDDQTQHREFDDAAPDAAQTLFVGWEWTFSFT